MGWSADRTPEPGDLVLLKDGQWPYRPGVCCWREHVTAAFTAAGARVIEIEWWPGPGESDGARSGALPALDRAGLVIAESPEAAESALAVGAPRRRVWALALPPEQAHIGIPSSYGDQLAAVADRIGGLLTDSELSRDSVERAAVRSRPWVEVFPPLATDQACPACVGADLSEPNGRLLPAPVAQLMLWRAAIERMHTGDPQQVPYSFALARLRGMSAGWAPTGWTSWRAGEVDVAIAGPDDSGAGSWTTRVQKETARALWSRFVVTPPARPRRNAVLVGFNLKFATELAERLDERPDLTMAVDAWSTEAQPSERTEQHLARADAIFAEWARPSAVWLSRHKRPGQTLIVRLHRYELDTKHPREIDIDQVDAVVYVSPPYGRRIMQELDWPEEKLVYIPNYLDVDWLDRPKFADVRFSIGMVGMDNVRKRFDLALDLLAEVRRSDPRFHLMVRSDMPWTGKLWHSDDERAYYLWCLERLEKDPLLRGAVSFDPPGRDMARWYRRVGHVISTSDDESFHMAPAEGMASGAVPVLRPWPGAAEIYDIRWIEPSIEQAAAAILANAELETWNRQAAQARVDVRRMVDPAAVASAWADLLHGDIRQAKNYFQTE